MQVKRSLTIDHTKCGTVDSTNFPVLVSLSHASLKTVANGGGVTRSDGFDILFYSDSALTILLSWEVEFYDGVNGILIAWVKIPTVSASVDTVFHMTYGDSVTTTFQGGGTGAAWNSNYKVVLHLKNGTTLTTTDSTANGNNGTNVSGTATTGKVDGGVDVSAGAKVTLAANLGSIIGGSTIHAIAMWVKFDTQGATNYLWDLDNAASLGAFCNLTATTHEWGYGGVSGFRSYSSISTTTGVWYRCWWIKTAAGNNGKFYINAVEQTSFSGSLLNPNAGASPGGQIGAYHLSTALCLDGQMDEFTIMDSAPVASWVTTDFNNQNAPGNIGAANFYTVGAELPAFPVFVKRTPTTQAVQRASSW